MTSAETNLPGSVYAIWRYPVKSMLGEELAQTTVTERGLFGDRAYALTRASKAAWCRMRGL